MQHKFFESEYILSSNKVTLKGLKYCLNGILYFFLVWCFLTGGAILEEEWVLVFCYYIVARNLVVQSKPYIKEALDLSIAGTRMSLQNQGELLQSIVCTVRRWEQTQVGESEEVKDSVVEWEKFQGARWYKAGTPQQES